jgi:exodeoxyribonuclease VII large subunit
MSERLKTTGDERPRVLSVSQLTRMIKATLEETISSVLVEGEISNYRVAASGHAYFLLKDEGAAINCVMFRGVLAILAFEPKDGQQVEVRGRVSVFEAKGQYQIIVEGMREAGLGALYQAFLKLKEKLQKEGLFDQKYKKPLPFLPQKIGVVTSPTGAAIRDILNIIGRRFANVQVILFPVRVQGKEAPGEIVHAIERLNALRVADVIIVGRGGGSIEDLWAFNEEIVARAIFASEIPIISAVGHEIDFTIADFVADLRAPTPSAAAELVVQNQEELVQRIQGLSLRLTNAMQNMLERYRMRIEGLARSYALARPLERVLQFQQRLDELGQRLALHFRRVLEQAQQHLRLLQSKVHVLNPQAVLQRGYSIVYRKPTHEIVKDSAQVSEQDLLHIVLARGSLEARVTGIGTG